MQESTTVELSPEQIKEASRSCPPSPHIRESGRSFDGEGDSTELFLTNTDGAKNMILTGLGVMGVLWNREQYLAIVSGTLQVWPMKGLPGWERPHQEETLP